MALFLPCRPELFAIFAKGISITVRGPSSSFIVLRWEVLQAGVKPQAISVISLSMEKPETDFCVLSRLVNIDSM